MRKKTFTGKLFSQVSMYVALLPLPLLGTVQISTVGIFTISNPLVVGVPVERFPTNIIF
jgi:hypothetical protein